MTENLNLATSVKAALTLGAAASLGTGVAFAQTAAPASSTAPKATNLTEITVTGSHIPQTEVAQAQPVVNISRAQIQASGFTNLGQVLQNLPAAGASFSNASTGYIGPFNPRSGYYDLNLYNLGQQRVLVLVNGHRWIPTLSGIVNLSTIPTAIIDRVEVLLNGASAIYGSDAVSGVINVITTKNFNGARASAYLGEYDANGVGGGWDGRKQQYEGTIGFATDKGSLLAGVSYRQSDSIASRNRTISAKPIAPIFPVSKTGTTYIPNGAYLELLGPSGPAYCQYPNNACVSNNGSVHPFTGADRYNYQLQTSYGIPEEDSSAYVQGHYDLTSNVTFTSSLVYDHKFTHGGFSPTPLALGYFGPYSAGAGNDKLPIGVSAKNPYNPFGVDLIPAGGFPASGNPTAVAWCAKYGSAPGGGCVPHSDLLILSETFPLAFGKRFINYTNDIFYYQGGFTGDFMMAGNQWTWNVNYIYGRNKGTIQLGGIQNLNKVQQALGPNCDPAAGCVPLNIFGSGDKITKAMADYVNTTVTSTEGVTERIYHADLAGNFWNSWYAGPWGAAAGLEYYEQDGFFQPDGFINTGNLTTNTFSPTAGRVAQDAEYAELRVPLARDLPGAKSLSVDLANRWTQFHVSGSAGTIGSNYEHASTGKVTFKWQPITQLLIRGTWSQSFREPSISELFAGQAQSFNNYGDPCISKSGMPPPGTFNCPTPSPTAPYGQYQRIAQGNPDLLPERATTRTVGFVWSPAFAPGLDLSLDYYHTEVIKAVGLLNPTLILNGCYLENEQNFCDRITRRGQRIYQVRTNKINTGSEKTDGYIASIKYQFPTTPIGQFSVRANANFNNSFVQCLQVSGPNGEPSSQCTDYAGELGGPIPKHTANGFVNWNYGSWSVNYSLHLIGQMWEPCTSSTFITLDPSRAWCSNPEKDLGPHYGNDGVPPKDYPYKHYGQNHIGTVIYQDLSAAYTVNAWNTTFRVGVNNLFNKNIPISVAYGNPQTYYYRIPGRFVYGRVTVRF
jgi:iron complex outermembrane receptor protein